MEYVHKQTINFRDDRTPLQRRVSIGYEGDNLVERLEFVLPELVGGQVAKLMITGADAVALDRIDDGRYVVDLTRDMIGPDGKRDAYVRIDGASGQIWQSAPLRIVTGKLPDVEEEIEKVYPTAVGQMLTAMAEHTGEMEAQEERVERAAQRAEEAAERAETGGGGSGGPGEDGGYYQPTVTDGVLTWNPSKADMPGVPASDVRGPAGQDGQPGKDGADGAPGLPGKSAYQYAQDGGYTGTEAEFAEKMAKEIPEAYILPVATADRLGGVKVGKGLVMDGETLGVEPEEKYALIEEIFIPPSDDGVQALVRYKTPDGLDYNFSKIKINVSNAKARPINTWIRLKIWSGNNTGEAFKISSSGETESGTQVLIAEIENEHLSIGISGLTTNRENLTPQNSTAWYSGLKVYDENITKIELSLQNGFGTDDWIKIMGVRA